MSVTSRLLALTALLLLPACSFFEGRTLVLVAISGDAADANSVRILVANRSFVHYGGTKDEIKRGFYLPRGTGGTVTVAATAIDDEDCQVASASRKVYVEEGGTTYVSLVLRRSATPCGPPAVTRDAGAPDLRPAPDAGTPEAGQPSGPDAGPDAGPGDAREAGAADSIGLGPSCREFAVAFCQRATECVPFFTTLLYGSKGTCEAREELHCVVNYVDLPQGGITPSKLKACADGFRDPALTCEALNAGLTPEGCHFLGGRPDGATCGADRQCLSGQCSAAQGMCGQCTTSKKLGEACFGPEDCEQPTDPSATPVECSFNYCVRPGGLNEPCDAVPPIDRPGRICDWAHHCSSGRCLPLGREDAPCIDSLQCNIGLTCQGTMAKRCRPVLTRQIGESCVGDEVDICAGGFCTEMKKCLPFPIEGEPCLNGIFCMVPAECGVDGKCALPPSPLACGN